MKKASFVGGPSLWFFTFVVALGVLMILLSPDVQAQPQGWDIRVSGVPASAVPLGDVIDASGELKVIPGMNARISGPAGTGEGTVEVILLAAVRAQGVQGFPLCNGSIATAETQKFRAPRTITANDFTGSGGIGILSDTRNQPCIDDLTNKRPSALPAGRYELVLSLLRASNREVLYNGESNPVVIEVIAASAAEINARWVGPEGEVTSTSPTIEVQADKAGTVFVYEQVRPGQTAQEAITSPTSLCLNAPFPTTGTVVIPYRYPGNAVKGLQFGKTYFGFVRITLQGVGGRTETKDSEIKSFFVKNNDPNYGNLTNALSNSPDPLGSTYSNLLSTGFIVNYSSSNPVKISEDGGRTLRNYDITQFLTLLGELSRRGVRLSVTVTAD